MSNILFIHLQLPISDVRAIGLPCGRDERSRQAWREARLTKGIVIQPATRERAALCANPYKWPPLYPVNTGIIYFRAQYRSDFLFTL